MIRDLLFASCALLSAATTHAADWKMDTGQSRLEFVATFEKSAAQGVFKEFDTRLRIDADKPAESRLDVTIVIRSADMASTDINAAIAGAEWFDFARFPRAEFHATDIRRTATGRFVARGWLSLKGVQQPVEVPFTWVETGDTARMEGDFTVKRGAFGIGTGEWASTKVIGADVTVRFSVRLRKGG